jgi:peptidoglycan/xylan/chitin deacetylase (PgdA/CDA1 family)
MIAPPSDAGNAPLLASFTVDVEPDCPPFLWTWRGMEEGMPRLLALLREENVRGTFFTTGDSARRYPDVMRAVLDDGHELACHGMWHRPFPTLSRDEARAEIEESAAILRGFAPVTSFRAPNLLFPDAYLDLLEANRFTLDSSHGKHKLGYWRARVFGERSTTLTRIPASTTSSVLRYPRAVRDPLLRGLRSPAVLFVHPWEFVDLTRERLRYDCRFRTGDAALACVRQVLRDFTARGARWMTMRELDPHVHGASAEPQLPAASHPTARD